MKQIVCPQLHFLTNVLKKKEKRKKLFHNCYYRRLAVYFPPPAQLDLIHLRCKNRRADFEYTPHNSWLN